MQLGKFMRTLENTVQQFFVIIIYIILLVLSNVLCIENVLVQQQQIDQLREHPLPEVSLEL